MDNLWKLMFEKTSGLFFRFLFSINLRDNKKTAISSGKVNGENAAIPTFSRFETLFSYSGTIVS